MPSLESPVLDILDRLPISAVISDASTGLIMWTNKYNVELAGATHRDQIIGRNLLEFIRADQHAVALRDLEAITRGERPEPVNYNLKGLDGRSTSGVIASTLAQIGGLTAMLSLITDVTLISRDLQAMQEELDRLRHLADITPSGIAIISENSFLYVNPAIRRALGLTDTPIAGRKVDDFVAEESRTEFRKARNESIRRNTDVELPSLVLLKADGSACPAPARISPTRWEGLPAAMVFLHDLACE